MSNFIVTGSLLGLPFLACLCILKITFHMNLIVFCGSVWWFHCHQSFMPFCHVGEIGQNSHFVDANMQHTCWWLLDYVDGPFTSSALHLQSILWKKVSGYCTDADRMMCICLVFKFFAFFLIKSCRASPLSSNCIKLNFAGLPVRPFLVMIKSSFINNLSHCSTEPVSNGFR